MLQECDVMQYDLSSIKRLLHRRWKSPLAMLKEYQRKGITLSQIFGQTEASSNHLPLSWWCGIENRIGRTPVFHGEVRMWIRREKSPALGRWAKSSSKTYPHEWILEPSQILQRRRFETAGSIRGFGEERWRGILLHRGSRKRYVCERRGERLPSWNRKGSTYPFQNFDAGIIGVQMRDGVK